MSRRPRPLEDGDQKHLVWGSARWSLCRRMRLAVAANGDGSGQYAALLAGSDCAVTADQIRSFVPESKWPASLDRHEVFVLKGDNTFRVHRRRRS